MQMLSIGEAAELLGVAVSTLRRWEIEGRLIPSYRTHGGHRRYSLALLYKILNPTSVSQKPIERVVCYARVSTYDQKQDLVYQSERLMQWCQEHQLPEPTLITDLGSGLNYKKKGLRQLFRQIALGQFSHLVITHKDRLLRFGSELLFELCAINNIKISIINDENQVVSREQELAQDVLTLMTVFTAKLHGHRSHKNKRKTQEIMQQTS